jgi:hypothetical protein
VTHLHVKHNLVFITVMFHLKCSIWEKWSLFFWNTCCFNSANKFFYSLLTVTSQNGMLQDFISSQGKVLMFVFVTTQSTVLFISMLQCIPLILTVTVGYKSVLSGPTVITLSSICFGWCWQFVCKEKNELQFAMLCSQYQWRVTMLIGTVDSSTSFYKSFPCTQIANINWNI